MEENGGSFDIGLDEALTLYAAAIVGHEAFANQLERLGIFDQAESLENAKFLRPEFLAWCERARAGEDPAAVIWRRIARRVRREVEFPERMPTVEEVADALAAALNEDPAMMSLDPNGDRSPQDVMDLAAEMHETMLAILLIEGEPGEEQGYDGS